MDYYLTKEADPLYALYKSLRMNAFLFDDDDDYYDEALFDEAIEQFGNLFLQL